MKGRGPDEIAWRAVGCRLLLQIMVKAKASLTFLPLAAHAFTKTNYRFHILGFGFISLIIVLMPTF